MKTHWVIDYETLSNCFIGVFEEVKTQKNQVFVIHESRNDIVKLLTFLTNNIKNDEWHVSFNGLNFDSQITEHILINGNELLDLTGDEIARFIYEKAQETITKQNEGEFLEFSQKNLQISQVDVFRLNH